MADIAVTSGGAELSPQTDPVSSFSFEGIHEKAMAFGTDTPAAEAAPEQVAAPIAETPVVEAEASPDSTNIDNASQAALAQLKDTDLVEVTVDGQSVQMPWSEARGGVMRQAKFTKEMQGIRQREQEFNARDAEVTRISQEREQLVTLLKSPEMLQAFIAKQYPQLVQQAENIAAAQQQVDPNDIATVGQIQQAQAELNRQVQAAQQQIEAQAAEREEALTRRIEDRQATAKLSADINTTIKGLFSEHPYIEKLIPEADQMLRYQVLQMAPKTPQETVEAFKTVFGGWVETYKSTVAEQNKSTVLAKQKLVKNNIQPPGGAPPQPAPTSYKKVNKMTGKTEVDWDAIRAVSLERLNNAR